MVATVATEVDDKVVLVGYYIDEAVKGTADAFSVALASRTALLSLEQWR